MAVLHRFLLYLGDFRIFITNNVGHMKWCLFYRGSANALASSPLNFAHTFFNMGIKHVVCLFVFSCVNQFTIASFRREMVKPRVNVQ